MLSLATPITVRDVLHNYVDKPVVNLTWFDYLQTETNHRRAQDGRYRFVGSNPNLPLYGVPMLATLIKSEPDGDGGANLTYKHELVKIDGHVPVMRRLPWDGVHGSGEHRRFDRHTALTVIDTTIQYLP